MDLRFLKSLVSVVDEGSIAAAAQREGITASAVSQRLQALEAELQVKLLLRSGRNVRPTPTCIRLLPQIRRLLEGERALTLSLAQTANVGRFRLGAISTALTDYIPRIIRQTSMQMPEVALTVHPGSSVQLYRAFQDGELDAVLCVAPPFELPKSMQFDVLARHPVGLIQRADIEETDVPFIVYSRNTWGGAACWRAIERYTTKPQILCELDALETIAIMVQSGAGVAMVPQWEGLAARFPDLEFERIGAEYRMLGLLYHTQDVDHPMAAVIKGGIEG